MNDNESKPLRVQKFGMRVQISEEMLHGGPREYRWKVSVVRYHKMWPFRWHWVLQRTLFEVWPDDAGYMYTQEATDMSITRKGALRAAKRAMRNALKQFESEREEVDL